jgi:hypothetical protein
MDQPSSSRLHGTLIAGVILLTLGFVFLLDNFDVIYIGEPVSHFWPLIIVAIGLARILQAESSWERRRGFAWIYIGLWLLVSVLHMFGLTFHNSWPLLLIGFGVNAIWKAVSPQPECRLSKG